MFSSFFYEKNVDIIFFFCTNIEVTNTADLRTWFYMKNKQKGLGNENCCMPQIKKHF